MKPDPRVVHPLIALLSTALACTGPAAASDSGSEPQHDSGSRTDDAGENPRDANVSDSGPEPTIDLRDGELDLMPLGDSITLGVNGGYRNDLYTRLVADGYDVDLV